jgi:hypothetical protein
MSGARGMAAALAAVAWCTTPLAVRAQTAGGVGASHLVVVAGAAGEPRYGDEFHAAALAIADAARTRFGVPAANVAYLGEDPARAPGRIGARSSKENVERALAAVAARARPSDQLWVVLIGHGSGQGEQSRFNLPGPDITAADFRRALGAFARQRVVFVNASSASGDFARVLAGPNRVVVTATKSALERNETLFARHFAAALSAPGADVDKDGRVTLLEAFTYARREVARAYEQDNRLLTEHAQLDDNGDGVASAEPGPRAKDGAVAATLALGTAGAESAAAAADPRVARLLAQRVELEASVATLRQRKDAMEPAAYERELERLLLELARTGQAIRTAGGTTP